MTAAEFIEEHQPRVAGLAFTAPFYDAITKPVRAPYPAGCVLHKVKDDCSCYTDQGTKLEVPKEICKTILTNGIFKYWDDERQPEHRDDAKEAEPGKA